MTFPKPKAESLPISGTNSIIRDGSYCAIIGAGWGVRAMTMRRSLHMQEVLWFVIYFCGSGICAGRSRSIFIRHEALRLHKTV